MSVPNVCRFCTKQEFGINIFETIVNSPLQQEIVDILEFLNASYIDLKDNSLPNTICKDCYEFLKQAYLFLVNARDSQELLRLQASGLNTCINNVPNLNFSGPLQMDNRIHTFYTIQEDITLPFNSTYNAPMPLIGLGTEPMTDPSQLLQMDPLCEPIKIKSETDSLPEIKSEIPDKIEILKSKIDTKVEVINYVDNESYIDIKPSMSTKFVNTKTKNLKKSELSTSKTISRRSNLSSMPLSVKEVVKSWTDLSLQCRRCYNSKNMFTSFKDLREHSKIKHKRCSSLYCACCETRFEFFKEFTEHMMNHYEELKLRCPYCNIQLENDEDCIEHQQLHKEVEYACLQCGEPFKTEILLDLHKKSFKVKEYRKKKKIRWVPLPTIPPDSSNETWTGYKWSCLNCKEIFLDAESLRRHSQESHSKCFSMKCVDCSVVSDGYVAFVTHVRRHRPYLKNYCHYCNHKYNSQDEEFNHVFQHFDNKALRNCDWCGAIFPSPEDLQQHIATYKPKQPKSIKYKKRERPVTIEDLTCKICRKVSKSLDTLRSHRRVHLNRPRNHTCDICGKAFHTSSYLTMHTEATHAKSKVHVCSICGMAFATKKHLVKHMQVHGEKQFKCDLCERMFRNKNQLRSHLIVHTDLKPYQCMLCDRRFKFSSNLKTHEYQHTGERPFKCRVCEMDFTNATNRNKHMRRRHGTCMKDFTEQIVKMD